MFQATFLTLRVSRLDNSLIINSRLPGYVNLTTSPFLATFQVQPISLLCLGVAACDSAAQHTHQVRIWTGTYTVTSAVAMVCLQFESPGVVPNLLEQTALLNGVTNSVPKLTQCRILNITTVS